MKIHGAAYLVIGILVAASSYYIDKQKFMLFIYIGLLMIAIGIIKIIFTGLRKPAKAQQPLQGTHQKFCPFCGSRAGPAGSYCQFCGGKV